MRRPVAHPASTITAPSASASGARLTRGLRIRRGPCRVASRQLFQNLAERYPTRAEQHEGVEPQIGDLLDDAPVALTAERGGDHLGRLLTNLPAHLRLARRHQAGDVRARGPVGLSLLDGPLDALEHGRRRRTRIGAGAALEGREEARALPGVAGDAVLVNLDQERVAVAVGIHRLDVLDVARGLALPPGLAARAGPEVRDARRQGGLDGRAIHPGDHQELAGVGLLHDRRQQALRVEPELVERHGSHRTSTPRPRRYAFASAIVWVPKWKIDAASAASAQPSTRPS